MKYIILFLLALFLILPVGALPTITQINQTHGESWISWRWVQDPTTTVGYFLYTSVDGEIKQVLNLSNTPDSLVPREYYLTGLEPNEKHNFKVYILDNSTSPPTLVASSSMSATTSQPGSYNSMIFILALGLLGAAVILSLVKMVNLALILALTSGVLNIYTSMAVFEVNSSFSTVCIIAAVIAAAIIINLLYKAWDDKNTWRD